MQLGQLRSERRILLALGFHIPKRTPFEKLGKDIRRVRHSQGRVGHLLVEGGKGQRTGSVRVYRA